MLLKKISKLIDLKSILTIVLSITFCILTVQGLILPESFIQIYLMVITFYFTKQDKKGSEDEKIL